MAVHIDVSEGPGGPPAVEVEGKVIEGRSLGQIAWMRLRRDKVAMGGGVVIVLLILVAIIGPHLVGNPDVFHSNLIDPTLQKPLGFFGGISAKHPLGVEPSNGRDILARIVDGTQYSLLIAVLATVLSITIGAFFGVVAGYFGGWVDTLIARAMDVFLAFPLLVFALALAGVIPNSGFGLSGNGLRIGVLVFVIGFFNWPYMGRIIRGQTLSLREREFVDAARSLLIPTNILFEAALEYLGVGLLVPTPSWGQMLSTAVVNQYYLIDPEFMLVPGLAIFIAVMAFNLFGDGLRDALDPKTR
jgi:peptide/nickel transport system permease protein